MPFILVLIGVVMVTAAIRDTVTPLVQLVKSDFTGSGNFIYWVAALLIIGAVGYVPKLKPVSDGILVLVILVLFLAAGKPGNTGGGVFKQLKDALTSTNSGNATNVNVGSIVGGVLSH